MNDDIYSRMSHIYIMNKMKDNTMVLIESNNE